MPEAYAQFVGIAKRLEQHYRDMQDIEFTVERGKLWMLQTRDGKRTAQAAVRIAVDMAEEKLITREEAVMRVTPEQVDFFLHPQFDHVAKQEAKTAGSLLATGLNVSPGAAVGVVAFDADLAESWAKGEKKAVIMVRPETKPDDVHGMLAAEGILTSRGGRTSHAALVARQFGKPAVVGVAELEIDLNDQRHEGGRQDHQGGRLDLHRRHHRRGLPGQAGDDGAGHHRPLADEAAALGRRVPAPGRVGQRRLPARRRARRRIRRRGHRAVPHRAHVLRDRAPAALSRR